MPITDEKRASLFKEAKQMLAREALPLVKGGVADVQFLWHSLSGEAARNEVFCDMLMRFGHAPLVKVRDAGKGKGEGVFACVDLPAGTLFTTYPCCGLMIVDSSKVEANGAIIPSPVWRIPADGFTTEYALDTVVTDRGGEPAKVLGHPSLKNSMACGHMINDSHTLAEAGSPAAYLAKKCGNCRTVLHPNGCIFMETTKRVKTGEELFFNYGVGYWQAHGDSGTGNKD